MLRAILATLVLGLLGCDAAVLLDEGPTAEVQELTVADFLATDAATPPRWPATPHPLELPDEWSRRGFVGRCAFYRLEVPWRPAEISGVYLFRLHLNAAVYFNGTFVGDGGSMDEPLARNWNRPLYFTLPPSLWRPAGNELAIRVCSQPGGGMLSPVQVGPERTLRARYELRSFLQVEASAVLCLGLVGVSLFLFGLYLRRRRDAAYLWLGGACLLWAAFSGYLFVRDPGPIPGPVLQWLAHGCIDWWIVVFIGFVHRFVGLARPRLERLLMGSALLGMAVSALAPPLLVRGLCFRAFHGVSLAALCYTCGTVLRELRRRRTPELTLVAATLLCLTLAALHDWSAYAVFMFMPRSTMRTFFGHGFISLPSTVPLLFFTLAAHLSRRFADALDEAERMSAELEDRVEQIGQRLARSFAERRTLEREQAAAEVRERVYRDLHDDIGAKLLSLVTLAEDPRQADLARAALQDLRDIVSHSARGHAPLQDLLGDWRAEVVGRAAAARLTLCWEQGDELGALAGVSLRADAALNLGRVLREAVSNVLRHAAATRLTVRVRVEGDRLILEVEDDGVGADLGSRREGRGVRNMRARAALLGGVIAWQGAAPRGCRVTLRTPLSGLGPGPGAEEAT